MKRLTPSILRLRAGAGLAVIAAVLYTASLGLGTAQDAKPDPDAKPKKKAEKKQLSGAELYAINCARCHPQRYATEFTAAQWKTIMLHMRVRANLPAQQAKAILKFLQEDSGRP